MKALRNRSNVSPPSPRNVAGQPVRGPDFWGRRPDAEHLWDRLERGSVLLAGPRRWGKSSLMLSLLDAPRAGWTVVYLDVCEPQIAHDGAQVRFFDDFVRKWWRRNGP